MEVALAALGVTGAIAAGLVWLLKKLFNQNDGTLKEVVKSSSALAVSINKLAAASEKQTGAIERQESATKEWQEYVTERFDRLDEIGNTILTQDIGEQIVEHQTVNQTVIRKD